MEKLAFPAWLFALLAVCGLIGVGFNLYKHRGAFSSDALKVMAAMALFAAFAGWNLAFAVWTVSYNAKAAQVESSRARTQEGEK